MSRCWECESEASPTIEVILPIPDQGRLTVALCLTCHRDVFTSLVTQLIDPGQVGSSANVAGHSTESAVIL
jgi:hypothetical protein